MPTQLLLQTENLLFLNRDHTVSVLVQKNELVVTTVQGTKILIPVTEQIANRFIDQLANDVQSNFVAVPDGRLEMSQ